MVITLREWDQRGRLSVLPERGLLGVRCSGAACHLLSDALVQCQMAFGYIAALPVHHGLLMAISHRCGCCSRRASAQWRPLLLP